MPQIINRYLKKGDGELSMIGYKNEKGVREVSLLWFFATLLLCRTPSSSQNAAVHFISSFVRGYPSSIYIYIYITLPQVEFN